MTRTFRTTTILIFLVCALLLSFGPGTDHVFAQSKAYWANYSSGGITGCLDKIDGAALNPLDTGITFGSYGTTFTPYYLYPTGATESPPYVIAPDTNPGAKRWALCDAQFAGVEVNEVNGGRVGITPGKIELEISDNAAEPLGAIDASCTGWTLGTGWACGGGTSIAKNADGTGTCVYNTAPTSATYYRLMIYLSSLTGGNMGVSFGGVQLPSAVYGSNEYYVLTDTTGPLTLTPSVTAVRANLTVANIQPLDSLDDTGYLGLQGKLDVENAVRAGRGSALYPSLTSKYDHDTGFWFAPEGNQINVSIGGLKRFSFSDGSMTFITANGDNIIRASTAEGIASGSDIRIGLDKDERALIICDEDDIGADFGIASQGAATLYVVGSDALTYAAMSPSGVEFSTTGETKFKTWGYFKLLFDGSLSSGDYFSLVRDDAGDALTDTDGQQCVFRLGGEINQSGTAAYDGIYVNLVETALGDGSTGDGNNLLRLAVGGTTRFKVSNLGALSGKFATNVDYGLARGATDTDITYLTLRNADGELCYIYPNADQNAIVVSGTQP